MSYPIFTKGVDTFTWSVTNKYPVSEPVKVNVITDYSDGLQLYAYDKGVAEQFIYLDFVRASDTDHTEFIDWLENVSVGPLNTFTYTDINSNNHTVRLMNEEDPFEEVDSGQWSGVVILREEI